MPDIIHPINTIEISVSPGATLFGADFFKNFRGGVFSAPDQSSSFITDLKLYLVVRGADQADLVRVPVAYDIASDMGAYKPHLRIGFSITTAAMEHSYLEFVEILSGREANSWESRKCVYLGVLPENK